MKNKLVTFMMREDILKKFDVLVKESGRTRAGILKELINVYIKENKDI